MKLKNKILKDAYLNEEEHFVTKALKEVMNKIEKFYHVKVMKGDPQSLEDFKIAMSAIKKAEKSIREEQKKQKKNDN